MDGGAAANTIKVSVVVPTYNTHAVVSAGIDALKRQTMAREDFEVIYVDDGSTDGTADLIADRIAGEPRFHLIRNQPSGWPGTPRNTGLSRARGEFVFFADDDDWLEPDALRALYLRAVRDDADIVIGRVAAHGRTAPVEVFAASMTGGDIRTDPVLMSTMTVHKLFRRHLLTAHDIRFPDGPVRLEDHLFTLRALLATSRVSVLHDQTVYHLVRDRTAGNISFQRADPYGYAASVALILGVITEQVVPGPVRDRMIANWYRRKMLDRFRTHWFIEGDSDYVRDLVAANQALAAASVPPAIDATLPPFYRLRSVLLRNGEAAALQRLCAYERAVRHVTIAGDCRWRDGQLVVTVESTYPHAPRLTFRRADGRVAIDLPDDVTEGLPPLVVDELRRAADVTDDFQSGRVRGFVRNAQPTGDVFIPTEYEVDEQHVAGDRFTPRFTAEMTIDPTDADRGWSMAGTWSVHTMIDLCGHRSSEAVEVRTTRLPPAAFVGLAGQLTRPYADESRTRLRLHSSTTDFAALRGLVAARQGAAREFGGTLRLDVPLRVGMPPRLATPVTVLLTSVDTGRECRLRGRVMAPTTVGAVGAVLVTEVAAVHLSYGATAGRWTIGVGTGDAFTDLRTHLVYRAGKSHQQWSLAPAWRNRLDDLASGLRRTSRRLRSRLHSKDARR